MTLSYETLKQFENALSEYTGAPYVVLTDCCTHALELCLRYKNMRSVTCNAHTYLSVPMMLYKLGIRFVWDREPWEYEYRLGPSNVWDSARGFDRSMYHAGRLQCLSFGPGKRLEIGHGGAILTDSKNDYTKLKCMAYDGRDLDITPWELQQSFSIGYHYGMRLETAAKGIKMLANGDLKDLETQIVSYPDCSKLKFDSLPKS